ncbi:hypothetical protein [Methylopila sp. 73B]|uniref:hypothetical protein n=1 Tax=Methylopila sp. 73B TaxID=1120792 RepID=UPI000363850F|nr:hypothetical protein [Methylopila sp. 73B]
MITPARLSAMIAASRLEAAKTAIVATLDTLMPDVTVESHPGKLDIADVVAKAVVKAPGVAVGWTRIRTPRDVGGTFGSVVEWAAYIVVEDTADLATRRRMEREDIAHAIGSFLLAVLADADTPSWGLRNITMPSRDPAPELRPVFTTKSFEGGAAYYAVTWTQTLIDEGAPFMSAATPAFDEATLEAKFGDDGIPPEILALARGELGS